MSLRTVEDITMRNISVVLLAFGLTACGNNLLDGNKVFTDGSQEARAMAQMFNEDNGNYYCVPKMNDKELVEFKAIFPRLFVSEALAGVFDGTLLNAPGMETMPTQTLMRNSLQKKYPCTN